jgi:hypothetical protein
VQTQKELFKISNPQLSIAGEWLSNTSHEWKGEIEYVEPLFSISFLESADSIKWIKSDNEKTNGHRIGIKLFRQINQNEVQFSFNFNNSVDRMWTIPNLPNDKPIIYNKCDIGKICLIAEMNGNPNLKLYALFIPRSITKIGKNGLWHLKEELLEDVPNSYKDILRFGRTGKLMKTIET